MRKSGFTLIELLVVVLIIGILAAIALPIYQRAVEKSYAAEAYTNLNFIVKQAQMHMLANGSKDFVYKADILTKIDAVPTGATAVTQDGYPSWKTKNFMYLPAGGTGSAAPENLSFQARRQPEPFSYLIVAGYFFLTNKVEFQCHVGSNSARGHAACQSLGGRLREGSTTAYLL